MKNLFGFELRKIIRQKSFYICFVIALALIALSAAVSAGLKNNPDYTGVFTVSGFVKSSLGSSSFFLVMGVFVALYCCDDVSNNTLKNLYSRGYSRGQVYFAKYVISLAASLFAAAACFLFAFIAGKITADVGGENVAGSVICQLVVVIAYHAVYFALAMIIGKVGGSVAINIAGPMLVLTVLTLLTSLLKLEGVNLGDYWLESAINGLTAAAIESKAYIKAIVMTAIYAAVFITTGYFVNKRKEL